MLNKPSFAENVLHWFDHHGRTHLPWQRDRTPYRVWISEIMLQQTQVATVIPYYQKFMRSFPDVEALAKADEDAVLEHWAGLGYYSRARNLHQAAKQVCAEHQGAMPADRASLEALPGIGRSTAAAILSLSLDQPHAILDGNVKRVLARYHAIGGWPGKAAVVRELWAKAEMHLPQERNADYTQAMMDLGATLCTRSSPDCPQCPLQESCQACAEDTIDRYPGKKPRKETPIREAVMLLITHVGGDILIEKRPPTGVWGGLWSLPEFPDQAKAQDWLALHFADCNPTFSPYAQIRHTFSHFHLHAEVLQVEVTASPEPGVMEADSWLWYKTGQTFRGGFPAPIQKLLKRNLL